MPPDQFAAQLAAAVEIDAANHPSGVDALHFHDLSIFRTLIALRKNRHWRRDEPVIENDEHAAERGMTTRGVACPFHWSIVIDDIAKPSFG